MGHLGYQADGAGAIGQCMCRMLEARSAQTRHPRHAAVEYQQQLHQHRLPLDKVELLFYNIDQNACTPTPCGARFPVTSPWISARAAGRSQRRASAAPSLWANSRQSG